MNIHPEGTNPTGNTQLVDENTRIVLEFVAGRRSGMCTQTEIRDAARQVLDALDAATKDLIPTDDEREAHRRVIDLWFANWRSIGKVSPALEVAIDSLEGMVSEALDAGFRRTEVPEPSAEPTCICPNTLGWHTTECVASRPEPETAEAQAYSKGFTEGSDQAHRDMQGEPSDARPRPTPTDEHGIERSTTTARPGGKARSPPNGSACSGRPDSGRASPLCVLLGVSDERTHEDVAVCRS